MYTRYDILLLKSNSVVVMMNTLMEGTWNYYGWNTELKQTINMEWKRSSDSEIYSICICIYSIQKIGSHYIHTDSVNINISCFKSTTITYRIFYRPWDYFFY